MPAIDDATYLRGMEHLVTVVQELSLARSLGEVMRIVRTAARRLTGADGATFVLHDDGFCYYADEDAVAPLWKGRRFPLRMCISGWVMRERQPAVIEDIYADDRIPHDAYRPTFVKSLAMVPIRRMEPIGAIGNYWAERCQPSDAQVRLLQALADSTAVAMENVAMYAELEKRVEERTAELVQANERLDHAARSLREFVAIAAHDLRGPAASIIGSAALITDAPHDPKNAELLDVITGQAKRVGRLVEDLMTLSVIDAGQIEVRSSDIDLATAARNAVASVSGSDGVVMTIPPGMLVRADLSHLERIIANLVSNALKHGRAPVSVEARMEGTIVILDVVDSGNGVPHDLRGTMFDRFSRSAELSDSGVGLGLSIVRELARVNHGDVIYVGERPGAWFRVRLPASAEAATTGAEKP